MNHNKSAWIDEFPYSVTICNTEGIIIYMNEKSIKTFQKYGGSELIGKSLFDCHGAESVQKIKSLLKTQSTNAYTIEKAGVIKLIYQSPWYEKGVFKGLIELSLEIPSKMEHFVRE